MYTVHSGIVRPGFQIASGGELGRPGSRSPFSKGALRLQDPLFRARGLDLTHEVPGLVWGTVNIAVATPLSLNRPDVTLERIDWTRDEPDAACRMSPETFSFVRCCLAHKDTFHVGLIYYPHPETKLATNAHDPMVLEVLADRVVDLTSGDAAAVICRADAFRIA